MRYIYIFFNSMFFRGKCDANLRLGLQKYVILLSAWMWRNHAHVKLQNKLPTFTQTHAAGHLFKERVQVRRIWHYSCAYVPRRFTSGMLTDRNRRRETLQSFPLLLTATETQNSLCRWILMLFYHIISDKYLL